MSGYPGSPNENNGLESLFAQMRQQQNRPINLESSHTYYAQGPPTNNNNNNSSSSINNSNSFFGQPTQAQPQSHLPPHLQSHFQAHLPHSYQPPSVTTPAPTPQVPGPQPHHSSAIMSPVENTPSPALGAPPSANRTSSLLNLLKFSQPSVGSPTQPAPIGTPLPASRDTSMSYGSSEPIGHSSGIGQNRLESSDLLAALMIQKPIQQPSAQFNTGAQSSTFRPAEVAPPSDTQAYLLQLLNQPKPAQQEQSRERTTVFTPPSKDTSQQDVGGLTQALEESTLDVAAITGAEDKVNVSPGKENTRDATTKSIFTYVNPFEQLAASSPRNRTPKIEKPQASLSTAPAFQILKNPRNGTADNKRKVDERSNVSSPGLSKRKVEPRSQTGTPSLEGRAQPEISGTERETVADALNETAERADREMKEAIARAEQSESHAAIEKDLRDMLAAETEKDFEDAAVVAARAIKKELEKEENSTALDNLPGPVAESVRNIIDDTAQGHIADSWESADAEDSPAKGNQESLVKVYNFPMRPWTSIHLKETEEVRPVFRDEVVMDIARLKKEFDQVDRTLVTASNNFIVYGMSKNGGIRIIRQDDGRDARLFTETHDRIFSVVVSASGPDLKEAIIGTGVSGTVYWALIKDGEGDHIEDSHPEMHGFALPPLHSQDIESPGGVLKTRARKSSAHPDFFAVGRGKYINIVWPSVIMKQSFLKNGKERIVDTEKYLSQQSLRINTGKAGKDFTFSEDDTLIVSLDKAGRVKFWDVRGVTKIASHGKPAHDTAPVEIKEPIISFTTTAATEKSWPTSVLFVDKLRPYQRGGALRYLVVGMKQNHTLQLWDLALGKPVQEIHLPHTKESDAVCSVLYHAATGMIIVGHPTRNSIYFLHLSAPKYSLPRSVTQAEYMEKLVASDSSTVKPESTACISGMREYSFANKGTLRSLDILQNPTSSAATGDSATLFELYAMHSKGVTCLNIKQADLGWTLDNKVINPVVAEDVGTITIETLRSIPAQPETSEPSQHLGPTRIVPRPTKEISPKDVKKTVQEPTQATPLSSKVEEKAEKTDKKEAHPVPGPSTATIADKSEKKKRRKATSNSETPALNSANMPQALQPAKPLVLDPSSMSRNGNAAKVISIAAAENAATPKHHDTADVVSNPSETLIADEVKKLFGEAFEVLHKSIADDRRTQMAIAESKHESILRLVSATLNENIEATLSNIVSSTIQKSAVPAILDTTMKAVNEQLGQKLNSHLTQSIPRELQKAIPDAISRALQQPQLLKLMSESLARSVAFRVEEQFAVILNDTITPAFNALATQTVQRASADIQRKAAEQVGTIERQRHADSVKIEKLTHLVTSLTETISSMAAAQSEFQGEFLRVQQQAAVDRRTAAMQSEAQPSAASGQQTERAEKQQEEIQVDPTVDGIATAMKEGQYENAIIRLLQSGREQEIFEKYMSSLNPDFLRSLTPLMLLSLGATITTELEGQCVMSRVSWLETILATFQAHVNAGQIDEQVQSLVPKIMGIYIQRLEHLFMRISNISAHDPNLKRLSQMVSTANRILDTCQNPVGSSRRGTMSSSIMSPAARRM